MVHPETKDTVSVTRQAFDHAWSTRGWELLAAPDATGDTVLTLPQLREYAEEHGIDLGGATRKPDVVAAIAAAEQQATAPDHVTDQEG